VVILKLKQAEVALADGRLEEALELLRQPALRAHRAGQSLITRLTEALLKRAGAHLEAGEAAAAVADCDRAAGLAGNEPRLAALRRQAGEALAGEQKRRQQRAALVQQAQQQLQQGHLALAEQAVMDGSGQGSTFAPLAREVEQRRRMLRTALEQADAALNRDDMDVAVQALLRARQIDGDDIELAERIRTTAELIARNVVEAVESGRLELAEAHVHHLRELTPRRVQTSQLGQAMMLLRQAREAVPAGDYRKALEKLVRLNGLFPGAGWIQETVEQLRRADAAVEALNSGPLGMLAENKDEVRRMKDEGQGQPHVRGESGNAQRSSFSHLPSSAVLPPRFLLQVDACGSFLVVCSPRITFGPVSGMERPDVGLLADPATPLVAIERAGDDWFLRGEQAVMVNDRPVTTKLLCSGDRIAPSPRCRFGFAVPHPASTTAVVDLLGARTPRADVRRVILLDRELIIGPGPAAHVRVDSMSQPMVLQLQGGRLVRRTGNGMEAIGVGRPVAAGGMSLVIVQV
jgi:tetratricopeptide (TPR) repeat protein